MSLVKLFLYLFYLLTALSIMSVDAETLPSAIIEQSTIIELQQIENSIRWLNNEITLKEKILQENLSEGSRVKEEKALLALKNKAQSAQRQFLEVASGVDIGGPLELEEVAKRDLLKELQDLLTPFVDALRRISQRPRKIEKLKSELETINASIEARKKALQSLSSLLNNPQYEKLWPELQTMQQQLEDQTKGLYIDYSSRELALKKLSGEKRSFIDAAQDLVSSFFRTKGKNLILSLASLITIFWGMLFLRERIFRLSLFRTKLVFFRRPIKALYNLISFSLALLGAVLCLYLLNDWVLVTIVVVLLMGILWSLKHFIPQFINEAKLIFNFGPVREGERVIWKGTPWKVAKLGMYSTLINEQLKGGLVRVPARELLINNSRPQGAGEKWFPTSEGDWVLLAGDIFGKVIFQSPDQVIIQKLGGSQQYFTYQQFIALSPENLSAGFRIELLLTLDYSIQNKITKEIVPLFQKIFEQKLALLPVLQGNLSNVTIEFHSAGESSLNLLAMVLCKGEVAGLRLWIIRKMQEIFIDICNEQRLTIPFKQLTVHNIS